MQQVRPIAHIRWYITLKTPSLGLRINDCCEYPAAAREIPVSPKGIDMGETETLNGFILSRWMMTCLCFTSEIPEIAWTNYKETSPLQFGFPCGVRSSDATIDDDRLNIGLLIDMDESQYPGKEAGAVLYEKTTNQGQLTHTGNTQPWAAQEN